MTGSLGRFGEPRCWLLGRRAAETPDLRTGGVGRWITTGRRAGRGRRPYEKKGKRPGLRVVGETWRRRDAWADCGAWLRVGSRYEDSGWPKRRSLRLRGYDYSQAGAYAVTICTQGGAYLFGRIRDGRMALNDAGRLVEDIWDGLPAYYGHVDLDAFVVMPDHVHGVIVLRDQPLPAEMRLQAGPAPLGASVGPRPEDGRVGDAAPTRESRAGRGQGGSVGSRPEDGRVGDAAPTRESRAGRGQGGSVGSRPEDGRVGDAAPTNEIAAGSSTAGVVGGGAGV